MKAGRLRERIVIEHRVMGDPDPVTGHADYVWIPFFPVPVPAEVLEGPGREPFQAGTIQAETTARINLRYFAVNKQDLMKMRILWDGLVFDIISAERDRTGRIEWRLRCKDGVSDG